MTNLITLVVAALQGGLANVHAAEVRGRSERADDGLFLLGGAVAFLSYFDLTRLALAFMARLLTKMTLAIELFAALILAHRDSSATSILTRFTAWT